MNTLSRQLTARFFSSSTTDYLAFRRHWSKLVNSERKHELKAVHHLLYLVLSGKDWRKAFIFPTNANKMNNGYTPKLYRALQQLGSPYREQYVLQPFEGLVSVEVVVEARKFLSHVLLSAPKLNAGGQYNCDAYALSEMANRGSDL